MGRIKKQFRAFTLLELIVVVAIITVLTAIAVPSLLTRLRNSRIQAANDQAQALYMATQDYLISLQRKGISSDKLTSDGYFLPLAADENYAYIDFSETSYHTGKAKSGASTAKLPEAVRNILTNAGRVSKGDTWTEVNSQNKDSFQIVVYPKTFTVVTVYYCEADGNGKSKYNREVRATDAVDKAYDAPFESVYGTGDSQEMAAIGKTNKAYVGQYPIPGHKVT